MNRAWIEARIPHQGRMCLLDEVIDWDAHRIRCRIGTHRARDNPLRSHGRLGAACGIEYAAQTMALHGALTGGPMLAAAGSPARVGLLAGVRDVRMLVLRLDDIEPDLICEVSRIAGDSLTALYEFMLREPDRQLLSGRASVVLDAGRRLSI
jgi:predicted hotdog family 3-hydroxylacyl-ACP dehydratase